MSASFRPRTSDVDRHVGQRLRTRRVARGLTQQQIADLVGITYQQVHKYEAGFNRIAAGRLFRMAEILEVPVEWFFEGVAEAPSENVSAPRERLLLDLMKSFAAMDDASRLIVLRMARSLASVGDADGCAA